jgi:hypothetical protein
VDGDRKEHGMSDRIVVILSDSELFGLLHGRESKREARIKDMLDRIRVATNGQSAWADIQLVVKIEERDR